MKKKLGLLVGLIIALSAVSLSLDILSPNQSEATSQPVTQLLRQCKKIAASEADFNNSQRFVCYLKTLSEALHTQGLIETSKAINQYLRDGEDIQLQGACHALAHTYGETAVNLGYQGADLLNYCIDSCVVGCFHGVGHGYISKRYDFDKIDSLCNPKDYRGDHTKVAACFHGVGHGIVDVLGINIPNNLEDCQKISNEEGKAECSHGVFMTIGDSSPVRLKKDLPEDMLMFCRSQPEYFQRYCYEFSGYFSYLKHQDQTQAGEVCTKVPNENRNACFFKMGEFRYDPNKDKNPSSAITWCLQVASGQDIVACVGGISADILANGNIQPEKSLEVCDGIPNNLQESCYRQLGVQIATLRSDSHRLKVCQILKNPFKEQCLGW